MNKMLDKEVKIIDSSRYFFIGTNENNDRYYITLPHQYFSDGTIRVKRSPYYGGYENFRLTPNIVEKLLLQAVTIVSRPLNSSDNTSLYNLLNDLYKAINAYRYYKDIEIDYIMSERLPGEGRIGENLRDRAKRLSDDIFHGDILRIHEEITKLLMP